MLIQLVTYAKPPPSEREARALPSPALCMAIPQHMRGSSRALLLPTIDAVLLPSDASSLDVGQKPERMLWNKFFVYYHPQ